MPDTPDPKLHPANPEDLEFTLAHALQFDGKKRFKHAGGLMAKITAQHLLEQLRLSGYVILQKQPSKRHTGDDFGLYAPPTHPAD